MSTTKISVRAAATAGALAVTAGLLAGGSTTATAADWLNTENVSPIAGIPDSARIGVAADGDATAVWRAKVGDHYRVATATRPTGGAWSTTTYLSSAVVNSFMPDVEVNASGDAVASWMVNFGNGNRLQVARRIDGGAWTSTLLGPADEAVADPEVGIDASGRVFAAWTSSADLTRSATLPVDGPVDPDVLSYEKATALDLAVTPSGKATAVWYEQAGDQDAVKALTWSATSWTPADTVDTDDVVGDLSVAVNKYGVAEAAYTVQNGGQGLFVMASRRVAGNWDNPETLSFNGDNSIEASVGIDGASNSVVVWRTQEGEVQYAQRGPIGEWADAKILTGTGNPMAPAVAMNDRGDAAIQWATSQPGIEMAVRPTGATGFKPAPSLVAAPLLVANRGLALDDQGNITIVTAVKATASTGRVLSRTYDTVAPVAKVTKPTSLRVNATKFAVAWSTQDRFGVPSKDVFVRAAAWNAGFGSTQVFKNDTGLNAATLVGTQGRTYCFAARGTDAAGNQGATSAYRCTTTPLDDRKTKLTGKWSNQKGGAHYLGTVRTTTKHGAMMKLTGVKVERLGLLVARGKGYGSVAVYFNGTKLGTFSLAATKSKAKQQIPVKDFGKVRTGTVVIKVVSPNGKPVKIDGLHLQKLLG
ncbi:hypothetical protein [Nocardioides speluncae]|uniref:hypothetical protein n=1 Tax=Nocardioides speluncae TaxID=2670337 RepID=UPI0012B18446|nr:hypothetical protein [Nocardioides speluncae]